MQAQTLDYDNTCIFSDKADARNTYLNSMDMHLQWDLSENMLFT
jgi:hypothetical protein